MKTLTPKYRPLWAVLSALLLLLGLVTQAAPPAKSHTTFSVVTVDRVLAAAIRYSFNNFAGRNRPCFCYVAEEAGGNDNALIQRLRHRGITLVGGTWFNKLPEHFYYASVNDLKWLTPRRARVMVYLACPHEMPIIHEAWGTVYINYTRHRWVADLHDSSIQYGE